jgi:hypothetical protein
MDGGTGSTVTSFTGSSMSLSRFLHLFAPLINIVPCPNTASYKAVAVMHHHLQFPTIRNPFSVFYLHRSYHHGKYLVLVPC